MITLDEKIKQLEARQRAIDERDEYQPKRAHLLSCILSDAINTLRSIKQAEPKSGHCLLDVPQNSPCAMAGYCVGKQAEPVAAPDGLVLVREQYEIFRADYIRYQDGDAKMPFSELRLSLSAFINEMDAALAAAPAAPQSPGREG